MAINLIRTDSNGRQLNSEAIADRILVVRGLKVMLDSDLAELYGVPVKAFNQAVRRNLFRFPEDFMFQLTAKEAQLLRSQIVTSKPGSGGRRYLPYVFTEQGAAMLASVLRSKRAALVNIRIVRTFVHLRNLLASHADLSRRIDELEKKYDGNFAVVFEAIRQLMEEPEEPPKGRIGFHRPGAGERIDGD